MKFVIKRTILGTYMLFFALAAAFAQKYTISGMITDQSSGESIISAVIVAKDTAAPYLKSGVVSNTAGFYSLTVDKKWYILTVSYMGYAEFDTLIYLDRNMKLNVEMALTSIKGKEVEVTAKRPDQNVQSAQVGKMEMKIEAIKTLPALMGEVDILKSIQLLPGIQSGSEGNTGFYVRGGNADQNLILLDDAPIYNAGHLFGFFSIFNADAVKGVEIHKSGIPAQYGGRLSSILDVKQKEGNLKQYEIDGGIGLIFSRLTVQGPIKKNKASFIVNARRTYIDVLIQPFLPKDSPMKGVKFYFYDLNGKMNWIINEKHRIYVGGYYGNDSYGFKSKRQEMGAIFRWSNGALSTRWNWIISPQLFLNTSLILSDYDFGISLDQGESHFGVNSGVRDYTLKSELSFLPNSDHSLKGGVQYTFHAFRPTLFEADQMENRIKIPDSPPFYANELAFYVQEEWKATDWLTLNGGLRYTLFQHVGPFTRYIFDDEQKLTDSLVYKLGEPISLYNYWEPRIASRFMINKSTSIKLSYTLNYQPLHQISMASITLPTDVWVPATEFIKPQKGHHFSLGLFKNFKDNTIETYIDGYYKLMSNLAEYKEGMDVADMMQNQDQFYAFGRGKSYGVEFYVAKTTGKLHGFIGYTLSYTKRQFDDLNNGEWFYAKYDRRHDVSLNLNYEVLPRILTLSLVWIYASGNSMTIPVSYYFYNGTLITEYSDRNAYRMPPYHRLDISVNWQFLKRRKYESGINFSIYNLYNRKNPFYIYFDPSMTTDQQIATKAYKVSLFPMIPSITWNFKIKP